MDIRSLSYSLLKILSLWIFITSSIPNFVFIVLALIEPYKNSANLAIYTYINSIAQFVITLVFSALLWFCANKLSQSINRNYSGTTEVDNLELNLKEHKLIEVGIVLIGLYILITQIPQIIYNLISFFEYSSYSANAISTRSIGEIVKSLTSIAIAGLFILGRTKILNIILKLKTIGVQKTV